MGMTIIKRIMINMVMVINMINMIMVMIKPILPQLSKLTHRAISLNLVEDLMHRGDQGR